MGAGGRSVTQAHTRTRTHTHTLVREKQHRSAGMCVSVTDSFGLCTCAFGK